MRESKTVHDSVHGGIRVDEPFLSLMHRPEMQRLHCVKQLGLSYLVFPGANHTRFEHSLGVFHLARRMGEAISLGEEERLQLGAAAMLHDICHPPFSHTLEEVMEVECGKDHMRLAAEVINGSIPSRIEGGPFHREGQPSVPEQLESMGAAPRKVAAIVSEPRMEHETEQSSLMPGGSQAFFGSPQYLNQMIHGPVDADQMDYLLRDAHYTGVAHGFIDSDRILNTISVHNGSLVVGRGGAAAVEGMMVARALMYSSIYFHKAVRIAEMMMAKAVECAPPQCRRDLHLKTEAQLTAELLSQEGAPRELVSRLLCRELYKKALTAPAEGLAEEELEKLLELTDYRRRKEKEQEVAERAGVDPSRVLIDLPARSSLLSLSRIGKTDVPVLDEGRVRPLTRRSPLAKALQNRGVQDWALLVSCPEEDRATVSKAASRAIFG